MDMTENNKDKTLMSWSDEQEMDLPEELMVEATEKKWWGCLKYASLLDEVKNK